MSRVHARKRVSIVFEETGEKDPSGDTAFQVRLDGLAFGRAQAMTPEERREKLSAAEFWAFECLVRFIIPALSSTGAMRTVEIVPAPKGGPSS